MMIFHFDLPAISDNMLYCNNFKGGKGRFVSAAGKTFKKAVYDHTLAQIEQQDRNDHKYTEQIKDLANSELIVAVIHCSSWYTKAGTIRVKDIQNYNKALIDSCFEALRSINEDIDDSQIWSFSTNKIDVSENGNKEYIEIIIKLIDEEEDDDVAD